MKVFKTVNFLLIFLTSFILSLPIEEYEQSLSTCSMPLELAIVIDSSDSVDSNIFDDIIFKTIEIVENLKSEFNQTTISIVNYSNRIDEVIAASKHIQLVKNKLISMKKLNGQSNPLLILEKVTSMFLRTEFDRIKMTIWLTDGNFNEDEYATVKQHSKLLKSVSHLFIVSTSNHANVNKLKQLASNPKNLFNINKLNSFYRLISDVTNFACKRKLRTHSRILNKNNAIDWLLDLFG